MCNVNIKSFDSNYISILKVGLKSNISGKKEVLNEVKWIKYFSLSMWSSSPWGEVHMVNMTVKTTTRGYISYLEVVLIKDTLWSYLDGH